MKKPFMFSDVLSSCFSIVTMVSFSIKKAKSGFKRGVSVLLIIGVTVLSASLTSFAQERPRGVIHALEKRAMDITRLKDNFVKTVLEEYQIPFQEGPTGLAIRIAVAGKWYEIKMIDIIPVIQKDQNGIHLTCHNIFFHTSDGNVLHLVSETALRRTND